MLYAGRISGGNEVKGDVVVKVRRCSRGMRWDFGMDQPGDQSEYTFYHEQVFAHPVGPDGWERTFFVSAFELLFSAMGFG